MGIEYVEKSPAPTPQDSLNHDDWVSSVQLYQNWILSGCYDNSIHIWSKSGEHKLTVPGHTAPVKCVRWIPSHNNSLIKFISVSQDERALLWEYNTCGNSIEDVHACVGHARTIDCCDVDPSLQHFATGGWDNTIKLWPTAPDKNTDEDGKKSEKKRIKVHTKSRQIMDAKSTLVGHNEAVSSVQWLGSDELISGSWDHSIRLWDVELGGTKHHINGNKAFFDIHHSSVNKLIIAGSADRHVRMYDVRAKDASLVKDLYTSHAGWVTCVHWSPDNGNHFVSGSHDKVLKLWDVRSCKTGLYDMTGHEDRILCCDWSHPQLMISGAADCTLKIYNKADQVS